MWQTMCEFSSIFMAVLFSSVAIKLLDDTLDQEVDSVIGRRNFATTIGIGTVVYAVLALALAACFNYKMSIALFFASYSVGMFNDFGRTFPSRLRGWQEAVVVITMGSVFLGLSIMVFSLFFISGIQCIDDCIDSKRDRLCGQRNLACRLGSMECLAFGLIFILSAGWVNSELFLPVFFAALTTYTLLFYYQEVG